MQRPFGGRSRGQRLVQRACKKSWLDKFPRGSCEMQAWRRKSRICKEVLTVRQRLNEVVRGAGPCDRARLVGLANELMTLARQAHKMAAAPASFVRCAKRRASWAKRLRTIAEQPSWMVRLMEAEAADLADQALRSQQQASRRAWRAWLDEHRVAGAAKVHRLIRELCVAFSVPSVQQRARATMQCHQEL